MKQKLFPAHSNILLLFLFLALSVGAGAQQSESTEQRNARMQWWRDARFGLFIHWGLYAIPAGEWEGKTDYGEWIRHSAHIPIDTYDQYVKQFNPTKFSADEWVRAAKEAGMKYIVITTKHHDGFCLFDSKYTSFDVMSTPFKRDVMRELASVCRRYGMKICWYYSIMDWHHPDYLPRREWEAESRTADGADFERYVQYAKDQLRELLTSYGDISVLWFDGEWESKWNTNYGKELYDYARMLAPKIIVNNRVSPGRSETEEFVSGEERVGDFGTPEQSIPATGLRDVDWESCMTMNENWGYNKNDKNWKSTKQLIRDLVDAASKGGNYLLNVGPTADGLFPPEAMKRLKEIGAWLRVNGESIYGTQASPFRTTSWGRCTKKVMPSGKTRLYFHLFGTPPEGRLIVSGLGNEPKRVVILGSSKAQRFTMDNGLFSMRLPESGMDTIDCVIALEFNSDPIVFNPPRIEVPIPIFLENRTIKIESPSSQMEVRYTTDGSKPTIGSTLYTGPFEVTQSVVIKAQCFYQGNAVSEPVTKKVERVAPAPATIVKRAQAGLLVRYFEGIWERLPQFDAMPPLEETIANLIDLSPRKRDEKFGLRFNGYVNVLQDGLYVFGVTSDDGARLYIDDEIIVDNDGLHGPFEKRGYTALEKGYHKIVVEYFNKDGGKELILKMGLEGEQLQPIRTEYLNRE